jgi:hypothetical protein
MCQIASDSRRARSDLGDLRAAHRQATPSQGGPLQKPRKPGLFPLFGERAAQVALAGLVDARAEAGRLIDELDREIGDCEREALAT